MSSFGNDFVLGSRLTVKDGMIIGGYNQDTGTANKTLHIFPSADTISDVRFYSLPESTDNATFTVNGTSYELQGGQIYRDATNVLKIYP